MAITKNARVLLKRTSTPGKIPTGTTGDESGFIKQGELAINTADKKIFSFDGTNIFEPGENSFLGLTGGTINGNLSIQGSETETQNLTVHGNVIIEGTSFTSHTENVYVSANTITLNNGEINSGVTKGYAGILIDRGIATQYEFAFEESSDTFRVGETGNTQAVATREDSPINGGYAYWNESEYKFNTTKDLLATTMSLSTISADTIYTHTISGMSPVNINGVVVENTSISANTLALAAGTTSKAPIQLTSGDLLDFDIPGAFEFNTDDLYLGLSTGAEATYVSQYPPAFSDTYVKATSYFTGGEPYRTPYSACNPSIPLTGDIGYGYMSQIGQNTNQRFHIDLGSAKVINRIYYENGHRYGYDTDAGVKNFTLWGSNSETAFAELAYGIDTNWTQITGLSQGYFDKHAPYGSDIADPRYITVINTTAYRYYALKIVDNWDTVNYNQITLRRIELQYGDVSYPRCPIVLADENKLTENKLPIATTNGRLTDSLISQTTGGTISISGNTNALSFSATSISADTLYSGSTNLNSIIASFATPPDGTNGNIQYNANGVFSGSSFFNINPSGGFYHSGGTDSLSFTSGGIICMWSPGKAAFRAGVNYANLLCDNSQIGYGSAAFGGLGTGAPGQYSFAAGGQNTSSGYMSAAFNNVSVASGSYSFSINGYSRAQGDYSFCGGLENFASSYCSFVIGRNSNTVGTAASWVETDPIIQIGNGASTVNRHDALRFNKNASGWIRSGSTTNGIYWDGIGNLTAATMSATSISANTIFSGNTNLYDIFESSPTLPGGSDGNIQYKVGTQFSGDNKFYYGSNILTLTDSSLLLSGTVGNTPTSGAGTRLMYIPGKDGAIRAGSVGGTQWDASNVGTGSVAFGYSTIASQAYAFACGDRTNATGYISAAFNGYTTASGQFTFAANNSTTAAAYASTAFGRNNINTGTAGSWVSTEPLFQIGNGSASVSNDAFRLNKDASGWIRSGSTLAPILYWTKDGLVGIGTELPTSTLTVSGNTTITGDLVASTKSFVIPHPTKEGKKLHYGSLEGPEHGVYYRGRLKKNNVIELPEYWEKLVDEDSISVELTPIGNYQKLFIKSISNNKIYVGNKNWFNKNIDCYFTVFAMREKINVEE